MSDDETESMFMSLRVIKNSKNINLPSKPKILTSKKQPKQQISLFLFKSSPLNFKKDQIIKNYHHNKSQKRPQQLNLQIHQKPQNQSMVGPTFKKQQFEKEIQNSDSLISSKNTSSLFYDNLNRSQSQFQINPHKRSISIDKNTNRNGNCSKSRSKLIRKQTVTQTSQNSQNNFNKLASSPQFMIQNRFYHYCAQQIIKLSTQTEQIKTNLKNRHFETKKIEQMNKDLEIKIEKQKAEIMNYHFYKQRLQSQRNLLKQQIHNCEVQIYQKLPQQYKTQYKIHSQEQKTQVSIKMNQIKKQEEAIQSLRIQLNAFFEKQTIKTKIQAQNQNLKQELQRIKNKRLLYDSKILKTNHIIKHLYQIKTLEYQNLLNTFNQ